MTWSNGKDHPITRHNARVRGGGTWSDQTARLSMHEHKRHRRETGHSMWRGKNPDRKRSRVELDQRDLARGTPRRNYGRTVAAGALILGAVLLMSPATRGAAVAILALAALGLYVTTGLKRA
jgi:hypothetical protein